MCQKYQHVTQSQEEILSVQLFSFPLCIHKWMLFEFKINTTTATTITTTTAATPTANNDNSSSNSLTQHYY